MGRSALPCSRRPAARACAGGGSKSLGEHHLPGNHTDRSPRYQHPDTPQSDGGEGGAARPSRSSPAPCGAGRGSASGSPAFATYSQSTFE